MNCRDILEQTIEAKPWLLGCAPRPNPSRAPINLIRYTVGPDDDFFHTIVERVKIKPSKAALAGDMQEWWINAVSNAMHDEREKAIDALAGAMDEYFTSRHALMAWMGKWMAMEEGANSKVAAAMDHSMRASMDQI